MKKQNGAALLVSLIMLALLMFFGTSTLETNMIDLKIAGNTEYAMDSLQKADAGIHGTISLIGTANDPFVNSNDTANPFSGIADANDPLQIIENEVSVFTALIVSRQTCGYVRQASSNNTLECEFYEINSTHTAPNNAGVSRTVVQGIRREIIAN